MKRYQSVALWFAVVGGVLLPAMSNLGYPIYSAGYVIISLASFTVAFLLSTLRPSRWGVPLIMFTLLTFALYYGYAVYEYSWRQWAVAVVALSFTLLAVRKGEKALLLAGLVAWSQIISTAIMSPSAVFEHFSRTIPHNDIPPVVHILLDEHTGLAAIPEDAVSPQEIQDFADEYIRQGFMVFSQAFTIDRTTDLSVARLLSNDANPYPHLWLNVEENRYDFADLSVLSRLGEKRALDITALRYINIGHALDNNFAVERLTTINETVPWPSVSARGYNLKQRLQISFMAMFNWFDRVVWSPVIPALIDLGLPENMRDLAENVRRVHALESYDDLQNWIARLELSGRRGVYYYGHFLVPHFPYVLDKQCNLIPPLEWRSNTPRGTTNEELLQDRNVLYRLNFEESVCIAHNITNMAKIFSNLKPMRDAVIFVHSDHGSRIGIKDYAEPHRKGINYTEADLTRDMCGSFIALRIPGQPGGLYDKPVLLNDVYQNLIENDFKKLDLDKLHAYEPNPYTP